MTEQYFSRGVSFRRGRFVCVLTRALISSFTIIFSRTFKRYIYICVCVCVCVYIYAILRVRGENAAFTLFARVYVYVFACFSPFARCANRTTTTNSFIAHPLSIAKEHQGNEDFSFPN